MYRRENSLVWALKKGTGSEFTANGIESMVAEMRKIKGVSDVGSELGNWDVNGGSIQKIDKGDDAKKANLYGSSDKKAAQ